MIFSYITKYKPNIDCLIDCYQPLMFSNNINYSTIRNLTHADIAIQHVATGSTHDPPYPVLIKERNAYNI